MRLSILPHDSTSLLRAFYQTELNWRENLAEERVDLGFCTAQTNTTLDRIRLANCVVDVALPPVLTPADAYSTVSDHFSQRGLNCFHWLLNPSSPPEQTRPMADYLLSIGATLKSSTVLRASRSKIDSSIDLQMIPARASYALAREIYEAMTHEWGEPQCTEIGMAMLDDPRIEASIVLDAGKPVGHIAVCSYGEIGRIEDVFVAPSHRRRGIGRAMLSRALDFCERAMFRHVLLCVDPTNEIAKALYSAARFELVTKLPIYEGS